MQFLIKQAPKLITYGKPLVKEGVKQTAKVVVYSAKTGAEFGRALVTGAPRYVPIVAKDNSRVATIWVSTRVGIQTRQAVKTVFTAAVMKGPVTVARGAVYAARSAVRDAMVPYHAGVHYYQLIRLERGAKGATSILERGLDKYVAVSGRGLAKLGLEPRALGYVGTLTRAGIVGTIIGGYELTKGRVVGIREYVEAMNANYKAAREDIRVIVTTPPPTPVTTPVVVTPPPVVPPPAPAARPSTPAYTPPPRGPVIANPYTPPVRK